MKAVVSHRVRRHQGNADAVGVAIVGCGYWGANYVRIFDELNESYVAAVCDQSLERRLDIARRFPGVYVTGDLDEAASQPGVQAVVVCTEATTHYGVTRRLLNAHKHVLVEKPITTTSADAKRLIDLAESNSSILMVGHTFVFNAGIRKVKEYIQKDGSWVYYLYARRTNLGPIRHDVNALWDLAPHDIAIFNYLLDSPPKWVSAVGGKVLRNCRDDVGFISLGYPNDILAHVHVSWADPDKAREVVVVTSERRIVFNDLNGQEQVRVFEKGVTPVKPETMNYGDFRFQIRDGDIISPRIEMIEPLKSQCRHFLECVRTGQRPISSGVEGRDVVRVLEAVNRSIEYRGLQVSVEGSDYVHSNVERISGVASAFR
ncbi:MAG: hypothetical protein DMF90_00420 [Acidobacteria bacterium]|nr:MAG: hypothetical protein DMF90_00420 [Acidobacteriota bacterium]